MFRKILTKFRELKNIQTNKTNINDNLFLKYMSKEDYNYLTNKSKYAQDKKKYTYN